MFYLFPNAVSKEGCEKLLEYCINNTNFIEASVLNTGDNAVDINDGRNDPSIRKTDIAFVTPDGQKDNKVNEIAWYFLEEATRYCLIIKLQVFNQYNLHGIEMEDIMGGIKIQLVLDQVEKHASYL